MADLCEIFPEVIMVEFLSMLPPKSLMRFKCVQKSWYTLIKSPDFVAKHLSVSKKSISSSTTILLKRFIHRDEPSTDEKKVVLSLFNIPDNFDDGEDENLDSLKIQDVHIAVSMRMRIVCLSDFGANNYAFDYRRGPEIVGLCDGIACLSDFGVNNCGLDIVLCNPAINEFKLLPKSRHHASLPSPNELLVTYSLGFGYDHRSKNYKLVRTLRRTSLEDESNMYAPPVAEVYNLFTNSWKEIESGCLWKEKENAMFWACYEKLGGYCLGKVYWVGSEQDREKTPISDDDNERVEPTNYTVSFDMSDETFHAIRVPDDFVLPRTSYDCCVFGLLNESVALCVLHYCASFTHGAPVEHSLDIWVMDEFGTCWKKYLALESKVEMTYPLTFFERSNQLVLVGTTECKVIFFNVHTRKYKYMFPPNSTDLGNPPMYQRNPSQAFYYVNSIVSIK